MLVPQLRADARGMTTPLVREQDRSVAVVLNANARKVTPRVIRMLSHVVAERDLFVSRSQLDCRRIAETLLERRYHTVFCGGGDGTFMGLVNDVHSVLEQRGALRQFRAPRFGVLKLGTGNSLAYLLHASSTRGDGILDDVLRARANEVPSYRRLDMLTVDGRRAQFAGLGLDGKLLNDYLSLKQRFAESKLKGLLTGGGGYFSSIAFKTIPYYFTHSTFVECEVTNGPSSVAYRLGPNGQQLGAAIGPGGTLFRGRLMIAAAGTVPYYGFGFKMFPYAAMKRGMMHLRLAAVAPAAMLANLPALWQGTWHHPGMHDFHAQEVQVRFARPMPLQVGGDAEGYRTELTLGVARQQVEVLDFTGVVN